MKDSFNSLLQKHESVLILLPKDPFFDQVASGLSLYLGLKKQEKDVQIISSAPMIVEFNRLVGVQKIGSELGNKNLVISLSDYDPNKIERVNYDIINNQTKITVAPKPGQRPPRENQVKLSYSGISSTLVILVGGLHEGHFPQLSRPEFSAVEIAHIGKQQLQLGREVASFARPVASLSEIVYEFIKDSLDEDIATNLLMGLYAGSKNFADDAVTADTFKLAATLMNSGAKAEKATASAPTLVPSGSSENREKPQGESINPPKSWTKPKVYKGTSIS